MTPVAQETINVLEKLDDAAQTAVLLFAEFLAAEKEDLRLYDEAKAGDDGYRVSSKDLRAKYGI